MKRHIFLSNRREPLPRWVEAFPNAVVKLPSTVARPKFCQPGAALIWLHMESALADLQELLAQVLRAAPGCPVVVLSNLPNDAEGYAALQAGASGYASSLINAEILGQIATVVANGGIWVGRDLKSRLLDAFKPLMADAAESDNLESLSPRQREVAVAVATGASNKEVARALAITERTVKAHLSSIFEHLGVRDRVQLALIVNRREPQQGQLKYGTGP
jgi:DNA-binding NarL/FixJ family response regulator